jgi:50S ribosomal protein L16 3-hydroxylase
MVSYAPPGGSVGPHVDSYDVFLLQGAGKRLWVLEGVVGRDDSTTFISAEEESQRLLEDIDVRVLGDFHTGPSFVLEPGDMLYLPPRIGHHGISMDKECMTYSIGCRAPSHRELITFFTDSLVNERIPAGAMLEDADLILQTNPGLISSGAIGKARSIIKDSLLQAMDDDAFFDKWFGEFISRSKRDHT